MDVDEIEWYAFQNGGFSFTSINRPEEISGTSEEMLVIDGDFYNYGVDGILEHPELDDIHSEVIEEIKRRCGYSSYPCQIDENSNILRCELNDNANFYFFMLGLYLNKGEPSQGRVDFENISVHLVKIIMGDAWTVLRSGWPSEENFKKLAEKLGITEIDKSYFRDYGKQKDFGIDFLGFLNFFHDRNHYICYKNSVFLFGQAATGKNYKLKIKDQSKFYSDLFKLRVRPLQFFTCCTVLSPEEINKAAVYNNICVDRLLLHELYTLSPPKIFLEIKAYVANYLG